MLQIFCLFVLTELALAKRILQQVTIPTDVPNQNYIPPYIPPYLPQNTPPYVPPVNPYVPPVVPVIIPTLPVVPNYYPPVTPQQPAVPEPISVLPTEVPNVFVPVEIPVITQPPTELVCDIPYPEPGTCAQLAHSITNPVERFKLECSNFGACAGANITLDYTAGTFVERIQYLLFTEMSSAYKAIVTIRNRQVNRGLLIENIECTGAMACEETTFVFEGLIAVADFKCSKEEYCTGCQVKRNINDYVGIPCAYY